MHSNWFSHAHCGDSTNAQTDRKTDKIYFTISLYIPKYRLRMKIIMFDNILSKLSD